MKMKKLLSEIISLPIDDRVVVVDSILKSLNPPESKIDKKWIATAKRRFSELNSGEVMAVPGDEVFGKIWNRLST
jgi:putative addiction module component (TIGR02574 family)